MRSSADLWPASPSITVAHRRRLRELIHAAVDLASDAFDALRRFGRSRRARRPGREDLPWNVGLDYLAETGYPPFVPRGN